MRSCCSAIVLSAVFCSVGVVSSHAQESCRRSDPPRLELRIYKYSGAETGEAVNRFSSFYRIIREKLRLIKEDVVVDGVDVDYLSDLTVKPEAVDFESMERSPDESGLAATWVFQNRHLLLLYGDLQPQDGVYRVTSSLYLGGLAPDEVGKVVTAFLPITPEGSANARDSHSMVALSALALDAMKRECDPAIIRHLLGKANYKALDLKRRGELRGDLIKIHQFIEDLIRQLMS